MSYKRTFGTFGSDDEIEMPEDFAGKGANPNVTGQAPPTRIVASSGGFASDPRSLVMLGVAGVALYLLFGRK